MRSTAPSDAMRIWIKANSVVQLLLAGAIVSLVAVFLKDIEVTLPNMAGGPLFAQVPLTIVLSLMPVIYFSRLRDANLMLGSIVGKRQPLKFEALIPFLLILSGSAALLVLGAIEVPVSWTIIQNLTLLSGVQMVAAGVLPPKYASLAPATWVLVAALFGHDFQNGSIRWWAFIIEREPSFEGWGVSVIVFVLGILTTLSLSRIWRYKLYVWNR